MLKTVVKCGILLVCLFMLFSCGMRKKDVKIGVSFGVGPAVRWVQEKMYMEERAKELGITLDVRFNTDEQAKSQVDDCRELIDSGINVLIIIPRNVNNMSDIVEYAKSRKVGIISYARILMAKNIDLFVGYDSGRIGQMLGQYISEIADTGDYILLKGDPNDHNAQLLYNGAMRYINPIRDQINIILDAEVPNWSTDIAKQLVKEAVAANGNRVNAILAPNDKIAGACAEALAELGVEQHVYITGMDAELAAVRRIVAGTQDVTVFMDLRELARAAVDEAVNMAMNRKVTVNAEFDNQLEAPVESLLITGKLITSKNIDKILIETGYFTREEVYGK